MLRTEEIQINIGPQHPATHGVFRMLVNVDGEVVTKVENKVGYLHRGMEKLAESRTYPQFIPYTDRLDYLAAIVANVGYVQTVEKLMGVEVPERAEYLRVIFMELQRIASHMIATGCASSDLGGLTPFLYCMRDRERILDMFEMTIGSRLTVNLPRIGGVIEPPEEFWPALNQFLDDMPGIIDEYNGIITGNEIFQVRTKGIGKLSKEMAEQLSATGPVLRASGVKWDTRKNAPYGIYDRFDFDVPTGENGDCFDRYYVRILEMVESAKIIRQAVRDIPEGPTFAKVPKMIKPPAGEVYHRIEGVRGELGFYIVSDGTTKPYRLRMRGGSFINIQMLPLVVPGWKVGDLIAILASLDIVLPECDR
ncbi:MAG TPA: NADH-quinone oxidoreductase subunit D [Candidatus Deferrimicrobium sp.]|nr:NADH-quinone oxidoreductase subunit D [Candidatus Deferrimicrobium sp.]